ncbi:MAG: YdcF family protein [Planctomycetota bacterium]
MTRILAGCIAAFGLLNALLGFIRPGWDANGWWIDFRGVPDIMARLLIVLACGLLMSYALLPEMERGRKIDVLLALALLAAVCGLNCATFYTLLYRGAIHSSFPIPLSLPAALSFGWIGFVIAFDRTDDIKINWRIALPVLAVCLAGFPLAQIFFFGKTDYSRPADAAIVFGARAYADGRASQALADRVQTACDLYKRGWVKTLIFSGGPGDGEIHETDVMRSLALQWGVRSEDIILDREGINTRATLANARNLLAGSVGPHRRILAVSHFYHLPRIKLESQRLGLELRTVPAHESYMLTKMPLLIGREVAALWKYYLIPPV